MRISPQVEQKLAFVFIRGMGLIAITLPVFIAVYVLVEGLGAMNLAFFLTSPRGGISGEGGISSCIVATLWLLAMTMLVLTPLGIGAGVYLAEYAPDNRLTRLIRYGVELLAGIPSIVFGLFGFALFVIALRQGYSILAGSLTLAILLLPFLTRSTEEALRSVPRSFREAAFSLGATKWQTLRHVLFPAALPGILTGIILCLGGALAESAPLWVTMGGSHELPHSPLEPGRALAVHIFYLAMETRALDKALAAGAVLVALIVMLNFLARWISSAIRRAQWTPR